MYLKENYYEFEEKIGKLIIESKYGIFYVTFDKEDYDLIKKYQWRVSKKKEKFYACTGQNRDGKKILYFSNIVMNFTPNHIQEVDHIDGNSLNNTKDNLRLINRIDNIHNIQVRIDNKSTGVRGISYSKKSGKYVVDFQYNKKRWSLREFKNLSEAVYLRYLFEKEYLKEYRNTSNDEYVFSLINSLSPQEKLAIEKYFLLKK